MKRKFWTEEENKYMRKYFPHYYTDEIAKVLKRSYSSVAAQAYVLKLNKSEKLLNIQAKHTVQKLLESGIKSRFQKGCISHNKGKKMAEDVKDKIRPTMFKIGNTPHNNTFDGSERIDDEGYSLIRVKSGCFILKHRLIWLLSHGPIPEGNLIVFKDGNKQNLNINNLEMISSKENMERNSITRYPLEVRNIIHLNNKLKKTIYAKE
ncbi:MAG: HNH endonuclease signature motif containing protein [Saprospiraceae bacterium]